MHWAIFLLLSFRSSDLKKKGGSKCFFFLRLCLKARQHTKKTPTELRTRKGKKNKKESLTGLFPIFFSFRCSFRFLVLSLSLARGRGEKGKEKNKNGAYLVDPASSHMLISKIKPCMSKYKHLYCETANGSLHQL